MNSISISPPAEPFFSTIRVPGSKSITNRALPLAALAEGTSTLSGVLFADDTRQMIGALQSLGYEMVVDEPKKTVRITGRGSAIPAASATLTCGNSGTTIRFLAALLATAGGSYTLDGVARMRQRPIGQLVEQLRALGKAVDYTMAEGCPPIHLHGAPLAGGTAVFQDAKSSQYISAILMAAPYAQGPVRVDLLGPVTSEPYVLMTLRMMEQFGVAVGSGARSQESGARSLVVPLARYAAREYAIEPDASNASYFLAAAAVNKGARIRVEGLSKNSLQGDVGVADVLAKMGAAVSWEETAITLTGTGQLQGITLDMNHIPDMVQTIAVVALFADSPTTMTNVYNLRVKETDRLAALEAELTKLGATVSTTNDSITIVPPVAPRGASIATYDDHRMAMAFAIAGLRIPGVEIQDPECTAKTYPDFFTDLSRAVAGSNSQ